MRLIDADKFLSQLEDQYMEHDITKEKYIDIEDRIMQQPTIDPVKHGRWVKAEPHGCWSYSDVYKQCSECAEVTFLAERMRYCPNCGARMEGEEDETD